MRIEVEGQNYVAKFADDIRRGINTAVEGGLRDALRRAAVVARSQPTMTEQEVVEFVVDEVRAHACRHARTEKQRVASDMVVELCLDCGAQRAEFAYSKLEVKP